MSFNDVDLLQRRCWEQQLVDDSPPGATRYLVLEAGKGGVKATVEDRMQDEDGRDVRVKLHEDRHFMHDFADANDFSLPCSKEDLVVVQAILRVIDKVASASEDAEQLLMLCFVKPQAMATDGGWLRRYAPRFLAYHEAELLERRLRNVADVLNA